MSEGSVEPRRESIKELAVRALEEFKLRIGGYGLFKKSAPGELLGADRSEGVVGGSETTPEGPVRSEGTRVEETVLPETVEEVSELIDIGGSSGVRMGTWNDRFVVVKKARPKDSVRSDWSSTELSELNIKQLGEEYIADRIYEAMGLKVPQSKVVKFGAYKVSQFIPGKNLNALESNSSQYQEAIEEIKRGFALDCLLLNYDVVGAVDGNIRASEGGEVYRLDNGGSLRFRARGSLKTNDFISKECSIEAMRLRIGRITSITNEEIQEQIEDILQNKERILSTMEAAAAEVNASPGDLYELRTLLEERFRYLSDFVDFKKKEAQEAITDKGDYESVATHRYFENWDRVEISGNPEIKDKIKKNIEKAEARNEEIYELYAKTEGVSVEELKTRLQARVEDLVGGSEFFRATRLSVLSQILATDRRWKSQFETHRSDGTLDPSFRAATEMKMFGFNDTGLEHDEYGADLPKEAVEKNSDQRPIYGYFSDDEHGVINQDGTNPPPNSVQQYGKITIKLKKDRVIKKTTVSFQDSLGSADQWPPSPASHPHFASLELRTYRSSKSISEQLSRTSVPEWGPNYTEAQFHGQLTVDDIESIHFSPGNGLDSQDIKVLKKLFAKFKRQNPDSTIELIEY